MGNQPNKSEYEVNINHPKFNPAKVITTKDSKVLETSMGVDEKQYDKWNNITKLYKKIPENLLIPLDHKFERKGLCGNTGTLHLTFPNYAYLLSEEIYNRKGIKSKFRQQELWYLFFSLAKAKKQIQINEKVLGDIQPQNIFLNEFGLVKVANLHSWPMSSTAFQKAMDRQIGYLSPEEMGNLEKGFIEEKANTQAQFFSIGLTLLSAATLTDYSYLYNPKNYTFDHHTLTETLNDWKIQKNYSLVFKGVVINLLKMHPLQRMDLFEIWQLLGKHEPQIQQRQNFFVDNAPQKLHHQIGQLQKEIAVRTQPKPVQQVPASQLVNSEYKVVNNTVNFPEHLNVQQVQPEYIQKPEIISQIKAQTESEIKPEIQTQSPEKQVKKAAEKA